MEKILEINLKASIKAKESLLENKSFLREFRLAAEMIVKCYRNGGRLLIAGNGGSAADAQHLAAEFVSKLKVDRQPIAALALTVDTSMITAIGNDYGYRKVFSRQLQANANKNDIFMGISTSGNSPNILEAFVASKSLGMKSILLSGGKGGEAKKLASVSLIVPEFDTALIQEIHIVLEHSLCEIVEGKIMELNG